MTLRKTITISTDTRHADYINNTFSRNINIDFIPDELILRNVTIVNIDAIPSCFILSSNIIPDDLFIASVAASSTSFQSLGNQFTVGKRIQNNYSFSLLDSNRQLDDVGDMIVMFQLEFIKY